MELTSLCCSSADLGYKASGQSSELLQGFGFRGVGFGVYRV